MASDIRSRLVDATKSAHEKLSQKVLGKQERHRAARNSGSSKDEFSNQNILNCSSDGIRCPTPFPDDRVLQAATEKNAKIEQILRTSQTSCSKCGAIVAPEFMSKHLALCNGTLDRQHSSLWRLYEIYLPVPLTD